MTDLAIELSGVKFSWAGQSGWVLDIPSWQVATGERIFLHGPSGCGKSTLLTLLGAVVMPKQGKVKVLGQDLCELSPSQRDRFRGEQIGFIFQQFNLLPWLSGLDNVLLALQWNYARRQRIADANRSAKEGLEALGLSEHEWLRPAGQLSVGQQQRVAAARALFGNPPLIIADEPTSALDAAHQDLFIELLDQACKAQKSTLVFVSHDERLSSHFDRCVSLPDLQSLELRQGVSP
ncbi:MAG: hypothetical protein RL307_1039 [Pseudomonadota bacterium]